MIDPVEAIEPLTGWAQSPAPVRLVPAHGAVAYRATETARAPERLALALSIDLPNLLQPLLLREAPAFQALELSREESGGERAPTRRRHRSIPPPRSRSGPRGRS